MKLSILLEKFLILMGQAKSKRNNMKKNKQVPKFESNEEYFIKNGGMLLEKQIALSQGQDIGARQLKILSEREIKKATNNYDPDLIVGCFRGGTVYKGTFDDKIVAIKTSSKPDSNSKLADLFLTEVSMAMVICHCMVRVYGCCLETCVPMVVYEFYPNKDLSQYLHGEMAYEKALKWRDRLRVAIDIAYALSYMHNALSKPVVHRHVTSFGILIDSLYHANLADFGYSVVINPGKKERKWPVQGPPGYIDPEYIETKEVTEKCDVYSFGVLMLELLTAWDPFEMARSGKDLVDEFVSVLERDGIKETIDRVIMEEGFYMEEIQSVTRLALTCVAKNGDERPTMISVVDELWMIQNQGNSRSEMKA